MNFTKIEKIFLIFLVFFNICFCDNQVEDEILDLNENNFDEAVKTYKQLFISLYIPWSPFSKLILSEKRKISEYSNSNFNKMKFLIMLQGTSTNKYLYCIDRYRYWYGFSSVPVLSGVL